MLLDAHLPVISFADVPDTLTGSCGRAPGLACRMVWDVSHSGDAAKLTAVYLAGPVNLILKLAWLVLLALVARVLVHRLINRVTIRAADAPLARLIKQLDNQALKHRADRLGVFVVFMTLAKEYPEDDQRDEKAKAVRDLAGQLKAQNVVFGLAAGASDATRAWDLAEGHDLTVVYYDELKIRFVRTFAADKPPTDEEIKKIADDVDAAVDSMSSLLEPLIIAILGVLVGGLVIAMYLPIFKLGSVVG